MHGIIRQHSAIGIRRAYTRLLPLPCACVPSDCHFILCHRYASNQNVIDHWPLVSVRGYIGNRAIHKYRARATPIQLQPIHTSKLNQDVRKLRECHACGDSRPPVHHH